MPAETIAGFIVLAAVCAMLAAMLVVESTNASRERRELRERIADAERRNLKTLKIAETHLSKFATGFEPMIQRLEALDAKLNGIKTPGQRGVHRG